MHTNRIRTVNRCAAIIEECRRRGPVVTETKPAAFAPFAADMNIEVGPVSGHEYRSMKDAPLVSVAKWIARGLLAVGVAGLALVAFRMLQK